MNKLLSLFLKLKIAIIDSKIAKTRKKIKAKRRQFRFLARDIVSLNLGKDFISLIFMRDLDELANEMRAISDGLIELQTRKVEILRRLEQ